MSSTRRPIALAAAVLTAAALGATALVLPATAAGPAGGAPAPAAKMKVTGGTLDWGILKRYREYVLGPAPRGAAGTVTGSDGARVNADGTFQLTAVDGEYDTTVHTVKASFKGGVTFASQAHGFEVKLSDFRFDTATQKVTADVEKKGTAGVAQDVPLADFVAGRSTENLPTKITEETATALGGPYKGVDGDPLTVKLQFEQPATQSPTPDPTATKPAPDPTATKPNPDPTATKPTPGPTATKPNPGPTATRPTATAPADGAQKVLSGRLTWGVMESFRAYVGEKGTTASGGATKNGSTYDFAFGKGELDAKKQKLNASFEGSLRFLYADHGIDMTFSNLRIDATGKTGTLVLDVKTATGTTKDLPFATLDLSGTDYTTKGGLLDLGSVPAVFTAQGSAVFAFGGAVQPKYEPGKPMDSLTLSVAVDKDATLPGGSGTGGSTGGSGSAGSTTGGAGGAGGSVGGGSVGGSNGGSVGGGSVGGNLASTGAEIPAGALLGVSGAVVAAGAGAVYAARRRRTSQV